MSNKVYVKKIQRGPALKLMICILRLRHCTDVQSEEIYVDDLVTIMFKVKFLINNEITAYLRMRTNESVPSNSNILIRITGDLNELFTCSSKYVEAELLNKKFDQYVTFDGYNSFSYFIELNITVQIKDTVFIPLPNYKLYEDTEFTDFELQGTDGNVAVHKTTLLMQSDVFRAIMKGEWKEKAEGHMKIDGVTVQTLQHLKAFMYLGILPDEGLEALLAVAARYLMDNLVSECSKKLVRTMKPEDFDGLVKLACQHNIPGLVRALVLRTPDEIITGIHELKISDQESKENDE